MKKIVFSLIALTIILTLYSCKTKVLEQKGSPEYISEVQQWHQKRISRLKEETGWLNLVGLLWLKDGENKFGSAKDNDIIFPSGPEHIGSLFLQDSTVTINVLPSVSVFNNEQPVRKMILKDDHSQETTILALGSLRWYIIKRTKGYAIRLRDLDAKLLKTFNGIERFPVNDDWAFEAKFEVYNPSKTISLPTQLGTVVEEKSPGAAIFAIDGKEYRLDAIDTGKRLWFIFADETNGKETYGAGRYLYMDKPDSNGNMIVDFNYAYNPPCVFTKYATCSFAPKQNHLRLNVTAGEKTWEKDH